MPIITVVNENGNEEEKTVATSEFGIKFPNADDETVRGKAYFPAWTDNVNFKDAANIEQTTTQCGDTIAKAYGSKDNSVYEVECVIADGNFQFGRGSENVQRNLDIDTVLNNMRKGAEVQIFTQFRSPTIQVTDVEMDDNSELNSVEVHKNTGIPSEPETSTFGPFPAVEATFTFGKEESD